MGVRVQCVLNDAGNQVQRGTAYETPAGHGFAKQSGSPAASAQIAAEKNTGKRWLSRSAKRSAAS